MKIETIKELRRILKEEKKLYVPVSLKDRCIQKFVRDERIYIWHFIKTLRILNFLYYKKHILFCKILYYVYKRKKNIKAKKLGLNICELTFDEGLFIPHINNIVVNGEAKVGKNCVLHGNNCIGRSGGDKTSPIIGDNVDIGVGASILGNIQIGNNIKIGAGAVVVKSCLEDGVTLVGIPAKPITKK